MEGYWKVANLMATRDELAILRRFRSLNMQNLLYLQAEIINLQDELMKLASRDSGVPGREFHDKDWWSLANGLEDGDRDQWKKILELREKLETYSGQIRISYLRRANSNLCNRRWGFKASSAVTARRPLKIRAWVSAKMVPTTTNGRISTAGSRQIGVGRTT